MWHGHVDASSADGKVTPVHLKKGELISILATGWVNFHGGNDDGWAAPEGPTPLWKKENDASCALVATVGKDTTRYPIGNGKVNWPAPADGVLTFLFDDEAGTYGDNSGSFEVEVVRETQAEKPWSGTLEATNEPGVKTGVSVSKGDVISITVTGTAKYGSGEPEAGPDGVPNAPGNSSAILPGENFGSALMQIGGGTVTLVGSKWSGPVQESGEIVFLYNDARGCFSDNSGSFQITLTK